MILESNVHRLLFPEFCINGTNQQETQSELIRLIRTLCLKAGFAGIAKLLIRSDIVCSAANPTKLKPVDLELTLALFFTMDRYPEMPGFGYSGISCGQIPPYINDFGSVGPELEATAAIMEILYT